MNYQHHKESAKKMKYPGQEKKNFNKLFDFDVKLTFRYTFWLGVGGIWLIKI